MIRGRAPIRPRVTSRRRLRPDRAADRDGRSPGRAARDRRRVRRRRGRARPRGEASTRRRCWPTSRWSSTARCPTTRSVSTRPARRRPARTSPTRRSAPRARRPSAANTGPRNNTGTSRGAAPPPSGATSVSTYFSANGINPCIAHRLVQRRHAGVTGRAELLRRHLHQVTAR